MVAHAAVVAQTSLPTITVTGTTDYGSMTDTSFQSKKVLSVEIEVAAASSPTSPRTYIATSGNEPTRSASLAAQAGTPSPTLLDGYQRPGSIRPFVLKALNEPGRGSIYYASQAIAECLALKDTGVLDSPQPRGRNPITDDALALSNEAQVKQIAVSHYWNERCRDFTPQELQELNAQTGRLFEKGRDDLHAIAHAFFANRQTGSMREDRLRTLREVFAQADPLMIERLDVSLGLYPRSGGGIEFYFSGEGYPVNGDKGDILSAVHLLPCGLGLRCDANEHTLAARCINYGECFASRFDELQSGLMVGHPERYAQTISLYERMLASIKAGRAEDFVR